ncbi:MAG TPA: phosphoribosyltransferase family protein [Candidatus Paceibacterota bacterium]|nr:phosphoribosyltransferase family protein [Candidatus Paceibacterota bacterium]
MPPTNHWLRSAEERAKKLESYGVFWRHDGNENRPYVRLRSGLLSNGYFNGAVLSERPALLSYLVQELVLEYTLRRNDALPIPTRVIGPAMGAITLAHEVARSIDSIKNLGGEVRMSFAEKVTEVEDGKLVETGKFHFKRNPPLPGERIVFVEDTITTAGSVRKVWDATQQTLGSFIRYDPFLLVLCNRTGKSELADFEGLEIVSYVDGDFKTWKEGENPFTREGKELVPPVENAKENWDALTRAYP